MPEKEKAAGCRRNGLRPRLLGYIRDPLRKNSLFLVITSGMNALFGSLFWVVIARFTTPEEVGAATALISAAILLAMFSGLGLDVSIIRFIPEQTDGGTCLVNTSLTSAGVFSVVLSLIFVAGLSVWSPSMLVLQHDLLLLASFTALTLAITIFTLQNSVFIAYRAAHYFLVQNIIVGTRMFIVVALVWFGLKGILSAYALAVSAACVLAIVFIGRINRGYRPAPGIGRGVVREITRYSLGNYIGENLRVLPGLVLPIIIVNVLEPEMSAYFYVAWMIGSLLFGVAYSTCFVLLAEGSLRPEELQGQVLKAMKLMSLIIAAGILVIFLAGKPMLSLFGEEYSREALSLLRIFAVSAVPAIFVTIFVAVQRVHKRIMPVIIVYAFIASVTVGGGYLLMKTMGVKGAGLAWLSANVLVALVVLPALIKEHGLLPRRRGHVEQMNSGGLTCKSAR